MIDPDPPVWYVGIPASGKTTAAIAFALRAARARGVPLVVVDIIGARNCAALPEAKSPRALAEIVWGEGSSARFQPRDGAELQKVFRAAKVGGHVELVVDEAALAFTLGSGNELLGLMRQYRHANVGLHLTTQHLSGDVPQAARALAPTFRVFRCTSPRSLEVLERELGLDPKTVRNLPQHRYLTVSAGFQFDKGAGRSRSPREERDRRRGPGGARRGKRNGKTPPPDGQRARRELRRGTLGDEAAGE